MDGVELSTVRALDLLDALVVVVEEAAGVDMAVVRQVGPALVPPVLVALGVVDVVGPRALDLEAIVAVLEAVADLLHDLIAVAHVAPVDLDKLIDMLGRDHLTGEAALGALDWLWTGIGGLVGLGDGTLHPIRPGVTVDRLHPHVPVAALGELLGR
jgi:hypothetical protein